MEQERFEVVENIELKHISDEDQKDRREELWKKDEPLMYKRDADRLARVLEMIGKGELKAPGDHLRAAIVLQHGSSIEHYAMAHELAQRAADAGYVPQENEMDPLWLSAAAKDRWLRWQNKPQLYGTQIVKDTKEGPWYLWPVDPSITDKERARFHVRSLTESEKSVEELRKEEEQGKRERTS